MNNNSHGTVTQYLELDSSYRNRKEYPLPSSFQVHSDLGQPVNKMTAMDPVSEQSLVMKWRLNNFCVQTNNKPSFGIELKPIVKKVGTTPVPTNGYKLHTLESVVLGGLQPMNNYYSGAILHVSNPPQSVRIAEYTYIGNNMCLIRTENKILYGSDTVLQIVDPSTACDSSVVKDRQDTLLFVPGGSGNATYNYYELYNITKSKSFRIDFHECRFNMIKVDSNITNQLGSCDWVELRKVIHRLRHNLDFIDYKTITAHLSPFSFPFKIGQRPIAQSGDFIEISKDVEYGIAEYCLSDPTQIRLSDNVSTVNGAYDGCTIRLICSNFSSTSFTTEDRKIISYYGDTRVATVSKPFVNDLSLYAKWEFIIFPPTETSRIKNVVNEVLRVSKIGNNTLDLKSSLNTFVSKTNSFYKDFYLNQEVGFLYGYIVHHIVTYDSAGNVLTNVIVVNKEFYDSINDTLPVCINSCQLFTPFKRNVFCDKKNLNAERFVVLEYSFDNHVHIKGSSHSSETMVKKSREEYKMNLVKLVLPNLPLTSGNGGYITDYPFVYVKLSNSDFMSNISHFMTNSRNANGMSFKVMMVDKVDETSRFVNLSCDMPNFLYVDLTKDLQFSVHLPDGSLFQTLESDTSSPYCPNNNVQINALFTLQRVSNDGNGRNNGINFDTYTRR